MTNQDWASKPFQPFFSAFFSSVLQFFDVVHFLDWGDLRLLERRVWRRGGLLLIFVSAAVC